MSTRGFIGLVAEGVTRAVYNHSDSYPSWLGVRMVQFVHDANLAELAPKVAQLVPVKEDDKPSPTQLADLKARGFWQDVSTGDDWYAALRAAQGSLYGYLEAGYFPEFNAQRVISGGDAFIEWGYLVNLDTEQLEVYEYESEGGAMSKRTFSFDQIRTAQSPEFLMAFEGAY